MGSPTGTGRISNRGHEDGLGVRVRRCLKGKRPRSTIFAPRGKNAQTSKAGVEVLGAPAPSQGASAVTG